jgi:hypothetical protein
MFERYTEKARRVIFFARYEASEFGSPCIDTEHLLLAIFREDKALAGHLSIPAESVEGIRKQIVSLTTVLEKTSTAVDLPLSHECKRVLAYAAEEADRNNDKNVGPEHLLLGLLREEKSFAAGLLRERGLVLPLMRVNLASGRAAWMDRAQPVQSRIARFLTALSADLSVTFNEGLVSVRPNHEAGTAPFLLIEGLGPEDRLRDVRDRIESYFNEPSTRYVWLLDPETRHVYVAMREAGLQEFKGSVLRTENPALDLPLAEIFG